MNMKKLPILAAVAVIGAALAGPEALAANVSISGSIETLTFGGQVNATNINTFFDGGTDAFGTAGGAANNVGITFSTPGEFLNAGFNGTGFNGGTGKFENVPSGATGVLYFASVPTGTTPILDDASGFSAISLNYSLLNNLSSENSTITFWSGLDGTGTQVGALSLLAAVTTVGCTSSHDEFCTWSNASQSLSGVAQSIVFAGNARTYTEFDAVSLTTVPLPASLWLMISGIGGLLGFARRRLA